MLGTMFFKVFFLTLCFWDLTESRHLIGVKSDAATWRSTPLSEQKVTDQTGTVKDNEENSMLTSVEKSLKSLKQLSSNDANGEKSKKVHHLDDHVDKGFNKQKDFKLKEETNRTTLLTRENTEKDDVPHSIGTENENDSNDANLQKGNDSGRVRNSSHAPASETDFQSRIHEDLLNEQSLDVQSDSQLHHMGKSDGKDKNLLTKSLNSSTLSSVLHRQIQEDHNKIVQVITDSDAKNHLLTDHVSVTESDMDSLTKQTDEINTPFDTSSNETLGNSGVVSKDVHSDSEGHLESIDNKTNVEQTDFNGSPDTSDDAKSSFNGQDKMYHSDDNRSEASPVHDQNMTENIKDDGKVGNMKDIEHSGKRESNVQTTVVSISKDSEEAHRQKVMPTYSSAEQTEAGLLTAASPRTAVATVALPASSITAFEIIPESITLLASPTAAAVKTVAESRILPTVNSEITHNSPPIKKETSHTPEILDDNITHDIPLLDKEIIPSSHAADQETSGNHITITNTRQVLTTQSSFSNAVPTERTPVQTTEALSPATRSTAPRTTDASERHSSLVTRQTNEDFVEDEILATDEPQSVMAGWTDYEDDDLGVDTLPEDTGDRPEDVPPLDIFTNEVIYQRFPRPMSYTTLKSKVLSRPFKKLYILEESKKKLFQHVRQLEAVYTVEDNILYVSLLFRFVFSRQCQQIRKFKLGRLVGNTDLAMFEKDTNDGRTERVLFFSERPDDYIFFMSCTDHNTSPYACRDSYYVTLDSAHDPPNQFPWEHAARELRQKTNLSFEDPRFIFNFVLMPCARRSTSSASS